MLKLAKNIDLEKVDASIHELKKYMKEDDGEPLISILEELKNDPANDLLLTRVSDAVNDLGIMKGAVLTYAPYVWSMLAEDPLADY